jgi:hypothetical protein
MFVEVTVPVAVTTQLPNFAEPVMGMTIVPPIPPVPAVAVGGAMVTSPPDAVVGIVNVALPLAVLRRAVVLHTVVSPALFWTHSAIAVFVDAIEAIASCHLARVM